MSMNQPPSGGNGQDPKRAGPAPNSVQNSLNPAPPAAVPIPGQPAKSGTQPPTPAMPEKHPMLRQQAPQSPFPPAVIRAPAKPLAAHSQSAPQVSAPAPRPAMPKPFSPTAPQQP